MLELKINDEKFKDQNDIDKNLGLKMKTFKK